MLSYVVGAQVFGRHVACFQNGFIDFWMRHFAAFDAQHTVTLLVDPPDRRLVVLRLVGFHIGLVLMMPRQMFADLRGAHVVTLVLRLGLAPALAVVN